MSVRTYSPSVRVGNWNEDLCLEEEQLKDFLEKQEKGELLIQKTHNLLKTILRKIELSNPSDGYLHVGDAVCLLHVPSKSVVAAYMSAGRAHEATKLTSPCSVACSRKLHPCPRNVFIVGRYDKPDAAAGEIVCYGQQITFTTLPDEGGQLNLQSDRATFMKHSHYTREQEITLEDEVTYNSAWNILCFKQEDRLETEGTPVPVNSRVFINHCKTNQDLAVHTDFCPRTPYGREYELTACTKYDIHKAEDPINHFMIVTGDLEKLAAAF
eukprot:Em0009g962a